MAKIIFSHETAPPAPPVGTMVIYSKADRRVYSKDELGNEVPLTRENIGTMAFQDSTNVNISGTSVIDLSGGTLTLAAGQILWAWVNKVGSSLADIASNQHSLLDNDEPEKHREINDAIISLTSLWSSQKISDEIAAVSGALTPYVVGKALTDPYNSIQDAIDDAVTAGASFTDPAVVIVKPGEYTENVALASGITVIALTYDRGHMTKLAGTLTYNSAAGGSAATKVATWVGIDVNGDGTNPSLQFSGANPQWLNITNCDVNSVGPAKSMVMSNAGTGSTLVAKDVTFNQTGVAGNANQAVSVEAGIFRFFKIQANSYYYLDAMSLSNSSQVDGCYLFTTGRILLSDTAGGSLSTVITSVGATESVIMGSSGSLTLMWAVNLGFLKVVGGANPSNVAIYPRALTVPFDRTAIGYTSENVQAALEEMEKKEDALLWFEGVTPPEFVNIDSYNFDDGSAFSPGVDEDIVFRVVPPRKYQKQGLRLLLRYCMSTSHTGNVRLKLDYRIKKEGEAATGGTDYTNTLTLDPVNTAQILDYFSDFFFSLSEVTSDTELIYCRLTRLGMDVLDTHTGDFCLVGIGVVGL